MPKTLPDLTDAQISHIIDYAWADEISFDRIEKELGVSEAQVIKIMQRNLKPGSFRVWRARVSGRKAKHSKLMRGKGA